MILTTSKSLSRSRLTSLEDKKFLEKTDLTYNGALVVSKVWRTLDLDLFKPQGLTGSEHTFERIGYFERVLSGNARDRFGKIYSLVSKQTLIKWEINVDDPDQFKRLSTNQALFAEWIFEDEELSQDELTLPVEEQEARTAKCVKGSE